MNVVLAATVFALVFLAELPDKSMFASLLLAARGRPLLVWAGVSSAFLVHVTIAVAAGGLLTLAPRRPLQVLVALLFLVGAVLAFRTSDEEEAEAEAEEATRREVGRHRTLLTAFLVIFIAEWGDLTQLLTANLAARYHDPVSVWIGAVLALCAVSGLAVAGSRLLVRLPMTLIRRITGVVLLVLSALSIVAAVRGSSA